EIKSLLCDRTLDREIDAESLLAYVRFRYCPEALTLFKNVRRLMPGSVMTVSADSLCTRSFYELQFQDRHEPANEAALASQLRDLLFQTVRRQMISDVPVGLFLSGGVDSGGLLAIASTLNQGPLKTFTIGFRREDQRFEGQPDDIRYAQELAKAFKTDHQEIILEPKI